MDKNNCWQTAVKKKKRTQTRQDALLQETNQLQGGNKHHTNM